MSEGVIKKITKVAMQKHALSFCVILLIFIGGGLSYFRLGLLEDPEFTVKTALVLTAYPGATAIEVEKEVTEVLSLQLQQLPEIRYLESENRAGLSLITVEIKEKYVSAKIPQIWDDLRKKVSKARLYLPPGVEEPLVIDNDFGEVYGHLLSLSCDDGYSYYELEEYGKQIKRELGLVEGVSRVELTGVQQRVIYIDISNAKLATLKISFETVISAIKNQNQVIHAGKINTFGGRLRVEVGGAFVTAEDIANLIIRPSASDLKQYPEYNNTSTAIRLGDFAQVKSSYLEQPKYLHFQNGKRAIAIAVSNIPSGSLVALGKRLDRAIEKLNEDLPHGIYLDKIAWQGTLIENSIDNFMINLLESLLIVVIILTIFMGWRMGVIIGSGLLLTILVTFIVMRIFGIDLHRVSLGALVVAMGMMVDNSIVISEGIYVRIKKGKNRFDAALEATSETAWPLLGATIIAILAFYPTFAAESNVGEFCKSLFSVIAISLGVSWILSITITPLQAIYLIKIKENGSKNEFSESKLISKYGTLLRYLITHGKCVIFLMIAVLLLTIYAMKYIKHDFFPDSDRTQFAIHYWDDEGSCIAKVRENLKIIEEKMLNNPNVCGVSTFVGGGAPRFYLPVSAEHDNVSYGQLIVNLNSLKDLETVYQQAKDICRDEFAGFTLVQKYGIGPSNKWKFEARFVGPADANLDELKQLANKTKDILKAEPWTENVRTNWGNMVPVLQIEYNQDKGRRNAVSRIDLGNSILRSFDGVIVGRYRQEDTLYPIIIRNTQAERERLENFNLVQIQRSNLVSTIPLDAVIDQVTLDFEDPIITTFNRKRAITVQANPIDGVTFPMLFDKVKQQIENIDLPDGYELQWAGEKEDSDFANASLLPGVMPALILMVLIVMLLFNSLKSTLIIFLTIPFSLVGVTAAMNIFDAEFGFMALLGAMSLSGMIIKNSIVLIDQIQTNQSENMPLVTAVVAAAKLRLRPVLLASITTILGVIPLLWDKFWSSMGITIMGGLLIGTLISMVLVPIIYVLLSNKGVQNNS